MLILPKSVMKLDSGQIFDPLKMLGQSFKCSCGRTHSVPLKTVLVKEDAISNIVDIAKSLGLGKKLLVVTDKNTERIAGKKIREILEKAGYLAKTTCISDSESKPVAADEKNVKIVSENLGVSEWLLAVGTGTINDIVKYVAANQKLHYVTFFTAASINGFASNRAVIDIKGVKKSFPANPQLALVCDLNIIGQAPASMNSNGFGDLLSYPISLSDWKLDSIINGNYYCPLPEHIAKSYNKKCIETAGGIPKADKESLKTLTLALITGGLAVTVTNTSAPVSGAEHLMSYLWDLDNETKKQDLKPHGQQIALATILASKLYEKVLDLEPDKFDTSEIVTKSKSLETIEKELEQKFGTAGKEMFSQYKPKHLQGKELEERIFKIKSVWKEIQGLKEILLPTEELKQILSEANAFVPAGNLDLSEEDLEDALLFGRFVRNRYTVLDLASEIGLLNKETTKRIIHECDVL